MQHRGHPSNLLVLWEHFDDPAARYRIRRAIELILSDAPEQAEPDFDRHGSARHDEEVLVGNNNENNSTQ
jgi:hypothetical protein